MIKDKVGWRFDGIKDKLGGWWRLDVVQDDRIRGNARNVERLQERFQKPRGHRRQERFWKNITQLLRVWEITDVFYGPSLQAMLGFSPISL